MRAVIQTGYGSADVMELKELEKPAPGDGEVFVRVRAASLAAGDYFGMRGTPFPIRSGWRRLRWMRCRPEPTRADGGTQLYRG